MHRRAHGPGSRVRGRVPVPSAQACLVSSPGTPGGAGRGKPSCCRWEAEPVAAREKEPAGTHAPGHQQQRRLPGHLLSGCIQPPSPCGKANSDFKKKKKHTEKAKRKSPNPPPSAPRRARRPGAWVAAASTGWRAPPEPREARGRVPAVGARPARRQRRRQRRTMTAPSAGVTGWSRPPGPGGGRAGRPGQGPAQAGGGRGRGPREGVGGEGEHARLHGDTARAAAASRAPAWGAPARPRWALDAWRPPDRGLPRGHLGDRWPGRRRMRGAPRGHRAGVGAAAPAGFRGGLAHPAPVSCGWLRALLTPPLIIWPF